MATHPPKRESPEGRVPLYVATTPAQRLSVEGVVIKRGIGGVDNLSVLPEDLQLFTTDDVPAHHDNDDEDQVSLSAGPGRKKGEDQVHLGRKSPHWRSLAGRPSGLESTHPRAPCGDGGGKRTRSDVSSFLAICHHVLSLFYWHPHFSACYSRHSCTTDVWHPCT